MSTFRTQMREAAYEALLKSNPNIIGALKHAMRKGDTAKAIEKRFVKKYGNGNLISNSAICAAYHIEAHPELLEK